MKHALLKTNHGDILVELNDDKAPATVLNFLNYLRSGFYAGTIFHRVINGFMIQGGGFEPGMKQKPTEAPIHNESQNGLKNDTYTIAMARTNDPHSATAQFFINVGNNDFLNYSSPTPQGWGYAVFGKVVRGQEVVDTIRNLKTKSKGFHQDVPVDDVVVEEAFQCDVNGEPWTEPQEALAEVVGVEEIPRPGNDEITYQKGFIIDTHEVEGAASNLQIFVGDNANIKTNANHRYDIHGFNTAGNASEDGDRAAESLVILFQNGPIPEFGNNGITIEALLACISHRLQGFQDGPFNCVENQAALEHVDAALEALKSRTTKRVAKGVEGTEQKH
jgi:peptidyl-prolyl cis-trans isomerase B (cyclophilin B)